MSLPDWTMDADRVLGMIKELAKRVERLEREPNYYLLLLSRLGIELGIAFDGTKSDEEVHDIIVSAIRKQRGAQPVDLTMDLKYVTPEQKDESRRRSSEYLDKLSSVDDISDAEARELLVVASRGSINEFMDAMVEIVERTSDPTAQYPITANATPADWSWAERVARMRATIRKLKGKSR